jgi:carbamate kinase
MSAEEAQRVAANGVPVIQDAGRGWRRVVASPRPLRVMERGAIRRLVQTGCVVVAAGGGGIPVVRREDGELRQLSGVPAVIDKDLASGLLAQNLGLDMLIISTTVDHAYLHYGTPEQTPLHRLSPHEARRYLEAGQFAAGSMAPKIEALASFVSATGKRGLISNPAGLATALRGESGTWVVPECA